MEPVSSPESTPLSFMPNFTLNQESDADKDSFVASTSSVNCFADVVVSQNYSDISRWVFVASNHHSNINDSNFFA